MTTSKFQPWKGERLSAAWLVGLMMLESLNGDRVPFRVLRDAMMAAGSLQAQSVCTILREARRDGAITILGEWNAKVHRDYRTVALNPAPPTSARVWLTIPSELSVAKPALGAGERSEVDSLKESREGHKETMALKHHMEGRLCYMCSQPAAGRVKGADGDLYGCAEHR